MPKVKLCLVGEDGFGMCFIGHHVSPQDSKYVLLEHGVVVKVGEDAINAFGDGGGIGLLGSTPFNQQLLV